jgi:hypothetical protein
MNTPQQGQNTEDKARAVEMLLKTAFQVVDPEGAQTAQSEQPKRIPQYVGAMLCEHVAALHGQDPKDGIGGEAALSPSNHFEDGPLFQLERLRGA